jgi:hypothetical protein
VIDQVARFIIPATCSLLPRAMDTPEARAMLIAIGLQESQFLYRRQRTSNPSYAPARGYWQFELAGGVAGVLTHPATREIAARVCRELRYPPSAHACWEAIEHNDILACVLARLLLLTCPKPNPAPGAALEGWRIYHSTWRPGAFKDWREGDVVPERWVKSYRDAWSVAGA